jgi:hypothetical protein
MRSPSVDCLVSEPPSGDAADGSSDGCDQSEYGPTAFSLGVTLFELTDAAVQLVMLSGSYVYQAVYRVLDAGQSGVELAHKMIV